MCLSLFSRCPLSLLSAPIFITPGVSLSYNFFFPFFTDISLCPTPGVPFPSSRSWQVNRISDFVALLQNLLYFGGEGEREGRTVGVQDATLTSFL